MRTVGGTLAIIFACAATAHADFEVSDNVQVGPDSTKSTFTATPGNTTSSLSLSSGIAIADGGIEFSDGSKQYVGFFSVNITTHITPVGTLNFTNTTPQGIAGSTTSITVEGSGSLVRVEYSCGAQDAGSGGGAGLFVWALRGDKLFGGQSQGATELGMFNVDHSTPGFKLNTLYSVLFDLPPSTGTYNYSLMNRISSGFGLLGGRNICVLSLQEIPQ